MLDYIGSLHTETAHGDGSYLHALPSVAVPGGIVMTLREGEKGEATVWLTRKKARALQRYLAEFLDTGCDCDRDTREG